MREIHHGGSTLLSAKRGIIRMCWSHTRTFDSTHPFGPLWCFFISSSIELLQALLSTTTTLTRGSAQQDCNYIHPSVAARRSSDKNATEAVSTSPSQRSSDSLPDLPAAYQHSSDAVSPGYMQCSWFSIVRQCFIADRSVIYVVCQSLYENCRLVWHGVPFAKQLISYD